MYECDACEAFAMYAPRGEYRRRELILCADCMAEFGDDHETLERLRDELWGAEQMRVPTLFTVFLRLRGDGVRLQTGDIVEDGSGVDLFTGTYLECREYLRRGETYTVGGVSVAPVLTRFSETRACDVVYRADIENIVAA